MLYVSTGDGGYANDRGIGHNVTEGNGQDLASPHGKMLRIDVNGSTDGKPYGIPADNPFADDPLALPEIWARGLRNPMALPASIRAATTSCSAATCSRTAMRR